MKFTDIYERTPCQKRGDIWFKREDMYAPMGYGSVNGSKLRQLVYLITTSGKKRVISGCVTGSPQNVMVAAVCKELGYEALLVTPSLEFDKYPMLKLAKSYGFEFLYSKIGYAKALEGVCFKTAGDEDFVVEANISRSEKRNTPEQIREFHEVGAQQTKNIPPHITRLIVPCGSCNSVVSVLYGLYLYPNNVQEVVLMGIGNNGSKNINYITDRLETVSSRARGLYSWGDEKDKIKFKYHNLNGSGYCKYEDLMPYNYDGIVFHPRYEGKIMNYIFEKELNKVYFNDDTLFWIVGSEPKK